MAAIRKRIAKDGSTSFLVRIRRKGHRPVTKTFSPLTDARIWAQSTDSAIRERRCNRTWEAERRTLADLVDRYREEIRDDPKKVAAGRLKHLDWWWQELGYLLLADLTPAIIAEARDKPAAENRVRKRTRSPATVNRYLATLSHALTTAVREWAWLTDNPMRHMRKKPEPRGRVRFLDEGERKALLAACEERANTTWWSSPFRPACGRARSCPCGGATSI